MSRQSGTKSKQGKESTKSAAGSGVGNLHDFIPNRFNLSDWASLTRDEDDSSFVGDVIDDILTNALDQCEKVHLKKQLMPYTLTKTKNVLLQLVQWYFIPHDEGEQKTEVWQEEKEPEPSVIDSWAQGSVPVVVDLHNPDLSPPLTQESTTTKSRHTGNKLETGGSVQSDAPSPEKNTAFSTKELAKHSHKSNKHGKCPTSGTSGQVNHSRGRSDSKDGKTPSSDKTNREEEVAGVTATVKSKRSIVRPTDGVVYDADGYIVKMEKIDGSKLPNYQVNVSYRVITTEYNSLKKKKEDEFMKNKLDRRASTKPETSRRKKSILLRQLADKYSTANVGVPDITDKCDCPPSMAAQAQEDESSQTKLDPYVPRLIETVDVCPGVIAREDGVVKKGDEQLNNSTERKNNRLRYLTVNVHDTAQLRLLPSSNPVSPLQRHSVLPAISSRRNIEAS